MKKITSIAALALSAAMLLGACGGGGSTTAAETAAAETTAAESQAAETSADAGATGGYIAVVSKGFQHQFWQAVKKGADQAAADFGVTITFEGPASESDYAEQVKMLNSAMDKNPIAIALAALDTESVMDQLQSLKDKGIPVIGFDSGVPDAPEGSIYANASTNNMVAGGLGAEKMFEVLKDKLSAATAEAPVTVGVVSQDQVSESVVGRTQGFVDKFIELLKGAGLAESDYAVVGTDKFAMGSASGAKVLINVAVAATTSDADITTAAETILNKDAVIGIFGSNELAAKGILQATNEGQALQEREIVTVGFDAGERQKAAVKAGYFLGSVTQDPYNIGYKAVELAFKAASGEQVSDVDTGAQFYTAANMDDEAIAVLLYD